MKQIALLVTAFLVGCGGGDEGNTTMPVKPTKPESAEAVALAASNPRFVNRRPRFPIPTTPQPRQNYLKRATEQTLP